MLTTRWEFRFAFSFSPLIFSMENPATNFVTTFLPCYVMSILFLKINKIKKNILYEFVLGAIYTENLFIFIFWMLNKK